MSDSKLEKVVCVLNPDDVYNMRKAPTDPLSGHVVNPKSYITIYEVDKLREESNVLFPDDVREGSLLMLSNGKDTYVKVSKETQVEIISNRLLAIQEIVSYLGARKFTATAEQLSEYTEDSCTTVKAEVNYGNNHGEGKHTNCEKLEKTFGRKEGTSAEWSGESNEEGFTHAIAVAQKHGLVDTNFIDQLIKQCNPRNINRPKKFSYTVDLNSDIIENNTSALSIMARITSVLPKETTANVDVDESKISKKSDKLTLACEVEFGDTDTKVTSGGENGQYTGRDNGGRSDSTVFTEQIINDIIERINRRALSSEVSEEVKKIYDELGKRALTDAVAETYETKENVTSLLSNYVLSSVISEEVKKIYDELGKRALTDAVAETYETKENISALLSNYTLSSNTEKEVENLTKQIDVAKEISRRELSEKSSNLQKNLSRQRKVCLYISFALGVISISALSMALFLLSRFVW